MRGGERRKGRNVHESEGQKGVVAGLGRMGTNSKNCAGRVKGTRKAAKNNTKGWDKPT